VPAAGRVNLITLTASGNYRAIGLAALTLVNRPCFSLAAPFAQQQAASIPHSHQATTLTSNDMDSILPTAAKPGVQ